MDTYGTRARVWRRTAKKTRGGLTRKDLKKNKWGRIVSKKQSLRAKKEQRLKKAGYLYAKRQIWCCQTTCENQKEETIKEKTIQVNFISSYR